MSGQAFQKAPTAAAASPQEWATTLAPVFRANGPLPGEVHVTDLGAEPPNGSAHHVSIPGTGHYPDGEAPERLNEMLAALCVAV